MREAEKKTKVKNEPIPEPAQMQEAEAENMLSGDGPRAAQKSDKRKSAVSKSDEQAAHKSDAKNKKSNPPKQESGTQPKRRAAREMPPPEETKLRTKEERGRNLNQILPYVLFWLSVFALVSFILELAGKGTAVGVFGSFVTGLLCGLLGHVAYLLPLFGILISLKWRRLAEKQLLGKKLLLCTVFVILLSAIVHVFLDGDNGRVLVAVKALYAGGMALGGGGLFGGFFGEWLGFCLRRVGTCLLALPLLLLVGIYLVGLTPSDLWQRILCKLALMRERREQRADTAAKQKAETAAAIEAIDAEKSPAAPTSAPVPAASRHPEPAEPAWKAPRPLERQGRPMYRFDEDDLPDAEAEPSPAAKAPKRVENKEKPGASGRRLEAANALYDSMQEADNEEANVLDIPDDLPEDLPDEPAPEITHAAPAGPHAGIYSYRDRIRAAEAAAAAAREAKAQQGEPAEKPADNYYAPFALPVRPEPKRAKQETPDSSRIVITPHELPADHVPFGGIRLADERTPDEENATAPAPAFAAEEEELGRRPAAESTAKSEEDDTPPFDMEDEPETLADPALSGISRANVVFETAADTTADEPAEDPPAPPVAATRERVVPMAAKPTVLTAKLPEETMPEPEPEPRVYQIPPLTLLNEDKGVHGNFYAEMEEKKERLRQTLADFGLRIQDNIECFHGPSITRYEFAPEAGVSVRSIQNRIDDISLSMGAHVRIEGLVMGKRSIGVEVPNKARETVYMRTILESAAFSDSTKPLEVPLGLDIGGTVQMCNLAAMPHLLIAGSTGSGKSVCINAILISLLYKTSPDDLRLILIDPKQVEFAPYEHIPHLYMPIITDMQRAAGALSCAVQEMERRFSLFKDIQVRDLDSYNEMIKNDPEREHLPRIIIVIDEFADLKMSCSNNDPETFTCRIAQKARAAGIHLIIGTQRPSVDVITGKLKTNIASRIAFTVKQQVDSRTILDINGAETLTGKGDMLYMPSGFMTPVRVQGPFVSDGEVGRVVAYVRAHNDPVQYNQAFMDQIEIEMAKAAKSDKRDADDIDYDGTDDNEDPKFVEAVELAVETQKVATSLLQRRLGVGYGRAAKIIDRMEELGLVSAPDGNKARKVLPTAQGYLNHLGIGDSIDADFGDDMNE